MPRFGSEQNRRVTTCAFIIVDEQKAFLCTLFNGHISGFMLRITIKLSITFCYTLLLSWANDSRDPKIVQHFSLSRFFKQYTFMIVNLDRYQ